MRARGFTIVELMVSIVVAGVALVGVYFYYATVQYAMREEGRISQAQVNARLGMELVATDLQRAGYLATPNSRVDPMVCPASLIQVQPVIHRNGNGMVFERDQAMPGRALPSAGTNVNVFPDDVILYADYLNANEYLAQTIDADTGTVKLQPLLDYGDPFQPPDAGMPMRMTDAEFALLFPTSAFLRIVNRHGFMQFTTVTGVGGFDARTIMVNPRPIRYSPTDPCGVEGWCEGCRVNVVTGVWYRIEAYLDDPATPTVNEALQTDLVRYELDQNRQLIPGTREVVVENAVDFQVWFRVLLPGSGGSAFDIDVAQDVPLDATVGIGRGDLLFDGTAAARPELIRSAVVRLTVRTRIEDPKFVHRARTLPSERIKSFDLYPGTPGAAHVRTYTTEVQMPNLAFRNLLGGAP
jgi:prepilin-type N-terminal cleavage/methylation domain-containing protein